STHLSLRRVAPAHPWNHRENAQPTNCATSFMGAFIRPYTQVKYSLTEYGGSLSTPCRQFAEWCGIQIKCTAAVEKAPQVLFERKGRERIRSDQVKNHNWRPDRRTVTIEELLLSSSGQTPLIEKGLISGEEFVQKISEDRRHIESY